MKKSDLLKALREAKSDLHESEEELGALQQRVQDLEDAVRAAEGEEGITKRDVAKAAWVAPIVMAVNLPNSVFAQGAVSPVGGPTPSPTPPGPTPSPTPNPTPSPTP